MPHSLEQAAWVASIAQAILVIPSLFFIWHQLKQNGDIAKAGNAQQLTEQSASFNAALYQDEKLTQLWYSFGRNVEERMEVDQQRYRDLLVQWLIFHENIFYQNEKGRLDEEIYDAWLRDLRYTVQHHNLEVISSDIADIFPGRFGKHLESL